MSQDIENILIESEKRSILRVSTAGSVDDGKSTLIGRLLHDAKAVFEDHLESLRGKSKLAQGDEIDYSLLTDGLKAEREQGITIDVAYRYFSTPKRHFILADTPGHIQYTRNMATGASTSALAILLVDARHGIVEQTKRHAFISALLGVPRILVAINKMDLVNWKESKFSDIKSDFVDFAKKLEIRDISFIPLSALKGDNVVHPSAHMDWYDGPTLLSHLENVYVDSDLNMIDFRFPVQYVIRPNQDFRGFAGKILSGSIRVGDEVVVLPSRKRSTIKSIETCAGNSSSGSAPQSLTLTLSDEVDICRGDMIARVNNVPEVKSVFEAMLIWIDETASAVAGKSYRILHCNRDVRCSIQNFRYRISVNDLSRQDAAPLSLNEIGRVTIECHAPLYLDSYRKNRETGNFVLVDELTNATIAAGMFLDQRVDAGTELKLSREFNAKPTQVFPEKNGISPEERRSKYGHKPVTIWLTGLSGSGKSTIGRGLERILFEQNALCYHIDGDNIRAGLTRDLGFSETDRRENIRRVAETARLLNDAGMISVCALISPFERDRVMARDIIGKNNFIEVYVSTPVEECERRDVKGLYKKARSGNLPNFTGVDSAYEPPTLPDMTISTVSKKVEESVLEIFEKVRARIWI